MLVRELMTARPQVVATRAEVCTAAQIMRLADIGFLPVVDNLGSNRLVGVITDRDIAMRCVAAHRDGSTPVGEVMSSEAITSVHPDDNVHDVMGRMRRQQVRRIPVVDQHHRVVGVVAQADIARRVGPDEPIAVERVLEAISQPA
jgi:CBS domain-containing protein